MWWIFGNRRGGKRGETSSQAESGETSLRAEGAAGGKTSSQAEAASLRGGECGKKQAANATTYPPEPEGLPVVDPDQLLAQPPYKDFAYRIRYTNDLWDQDRPILEHILKNTAAMVQLLPASETHHHRYPGGLLCHLLDVARCAVDMLDTRHVLDYDGICPPSVRREKRPLWRLGITVSALAHDLGKTYGLFQITDKSGKLIWNPFTGTLYDWCRANRLDRYYLSWRKDRGQMHHELFNAPLLHRIVPPSFWDCITRVDASIAQALAQTLAREDCLFKRLVDEADQASVIRDLKQAPSPGAYPAKAPPEYCVVEAIHELLRQGIWGINRNDSVLWYSISEGVFLEWPTAVPDLLDMLNKLKMADEIPRNPCELRDLLIERGVARAIHDHGETFDFVLITHERLEDTSKQLLTYVPAIRIDRYAPFMPDPSQYISVHLRYLLPDISRKKADLEIRKQGLLPNLAAALVYQESTAPDVKPRMPGGIPILPSKYQTADSTSVASGSQDENVIASEARQQATPSSAERVDGAESNVMATESKQNADAGKTQHVASGERQKDNIQTTPLRAESGNSSKNVIVLRYGDGAGGKASLRPVETAVDILANCPSDPELRRKAKQMLDTMLATLSRKPKFLVERQGEYLLSHPELCQSSGLDAGEVISTLYKAGCIENDPGDLKKSVIRDGKTYLKLHRKIAPAFLERLNLNRQQKNPSTVEKKPSTTESSLAAKPEIKNANTIGSQQERHCDREPNGIESQQEITKKLLELVDRWQEKQRNFGDLAKELEVSRTTLWRWKGGMIDLKDQKSMTTLIHKIESLLKKLNQS